MSIMVVFFWSGTLVLDVIVALVLDATPEAVAMFVAKIGEH